MKNGKRTVMHIVKLDPKKIGSFEEYMIALGNGLKRKGAEVIVVFEGEVPPGLRHRYDGLKLRRLSMGDGPIGFYYGLFKLIREYKPDLIHFSFYPIFTMMTFFVYMAGGRNILFSDRVSGVIGRKRGIKRILVYLRNRFLLKFIRKILCVSMYVLERDREMIPGMDPTKLICVFNGVNLTRYGSVQADPVIQRDFDIKDTDFVVVSAAHLVKVKGIEYIVKAAKRLTGKYDNLKFLVAGEGRDEKALKALVRDLDMEERFRFIGMRNDIEKLISSGNVFVYPSVWQEACAFSIIEAAACGVPVVATRVGGTAEIVEDGVTGMLIKPEDDTAVADAVEYLRNNSEVREQMARNASERARMLFDLNRMVKETIGIYGNYINI